MKKIVFLLAVISAVGCHDDDPVDMVIEVNTVADLIGEYRGIYTFECYPNSPYPCESLVQDSVVSIQETSETSVLVGGIEFQADENAKLSCCPDSNDRPEGTIRNDTLMTNQTVRQHGIPNEYRFIGVKGAKSPLRAGSVGFRSEASEALEQAPETNIELEIEGAKFGAAIIIEILNTSTAVIHQDFAIKDYPSDGCVILNQKKGESPSYKIALTVMPNATSARIRLVIWGDDLVPNPPRTIQIRISDETVGVTPSDNRTHTLTILDHD